MARARLYPYMLVLNPKAISYMWVLYLGSVSVVCMVLWRWELRRVASVCPIGYLHIRISHRVMHTVLTHMNITHERIQKRL